MQLPPLPPCANNFDYRGNNLFFADINRDCFGNGLILEVNFGTKFISFLEAAMKYLLREKFKLNFLFFLVSEVKMEGPFFQK